MRIRHWDSSFDGPLTEAALREKLESTGYIVSRAVYPPGHTWPERVDKVDTIEAVLAGRLRVVVAGHFALLGPGDRVTMARGTHHSGAVVGDEPVTSLVGMQVRSIEPV
jgi:quercetin dioxygenase-like cupin family protein